jgi:hypothetical protein
MRAKLAQWGGNASGVNVANIDNLGIVHPDTMWWHHDLGNVRERPSRRIWMDTSDPLMAGLKQRPRPVKGRCAACATRICGGNTRVRAQQVTGDPGRKTRAATSTTRRSAHRCSLAARLQTAPHEDRDFEPCVIAASGRRPAGRMASVAGPGPGACSSAMPAQPEGPSAPNATSSTARPATAPSALGAMGPALLPESLAACARRGAKVIARGPHGDPDAGLRRQAQAPTRSQALAALDLHAAARFAALGDATTSAPRSIVTPAKPAAGPASRRPTR